MKRVKISTNSCCCELVIGFCSNSLHFHLFDSWAIPCCLLKSKGDDRFGFQSFNSRLLGCKQGTPIAVNMPSA